MSASHTKPAPSSLIVAAGVVTLFVLASILANQYQDTLFVLAEQGMWGMGVYVAVTIVAIVLAPLSTFPLIPVAVHMWGWVTTAVLSIIGWTIGSQIAFYIARAYGQGVVRRYMSLERLRTFEKRFSRSDLFWTVVFLRMTVPVDILSYALGLFSTIPARLFFIATLVGVTPFAFIFAYVGTLPPYTQILALGLAGLLVATLHYVRQPKIHKA